MEGMGIMDENIRIVYFITTSLTTIGFGDFNPKSDMERVLIVIILLAGVVIFSNFIGGVIDLIKTREDYLYDPQVDTAEIDRFMFLMEKFNGGEVMKDEEAVRDYF